MIGIEFTKINPKVIKQHLKYVVSQAPGSGAQVLIKVLQHPCKCCCRPHRDTPGQQQRPLTRRVKAAGVTTNSPPIN